MNAISATKSKVNRILPKDDEKSATVIEDTLTTASPAKRKCLSRKEIISTHKSAKRKNDCVQAVNNIMLHEQHLRGKRDKESVRKWWILADAMTSTPVTTKELDSKT